jgi:sugar lactone lactonase YvrE
VRNIFGVAGATIAVALLAACSGGAPGTGSTLPTGASQNHVQNDLARSGVTPHFVGFQRVMHALHVLPGKKKKGGDLFVDDFSLNAAVELANKTWTDVGSITSGMDGPDGNWVDKKGNLYVANYVNAEINEYAKNHTSPKYTYSGVTDPVDVTTDAKGNVYEADFGGAYVTEFAQGGSETAQCSTANDPAEGVVADKAGDIFVSTENALVEFKGGLSGCSMTTLYGDLSFGGGLAMDTKGNILVCDQDFEVIDVFKAPYTSISSTFGSGYSDPFHITINKNNKQAYVTNYGASVFVMSYPSGSVQATLNSSNGLSSPLGAVDTANLNP